jgi:hypothetical protein
MEKFILEKTYIKSSMGTIERNFKAENVDKK